MSIATNDIDLDFHENKVLAYLENCLNVIRERYDECISFATENATSSLDSFCYRKISNKVVLFKNEKDDDVLEKDGKEKFSPIAAAIRRANDAGIDMSERKPEKGDLSIEVLDKAWQRYVKQREKETGKKFSDI
jgi:phosphoribulokinase